MSASGDSCVVLIAAPDLLETLAERVSEPARETFAFADADALRALDVIINRRPGVIALEQQFAATPRGTALINRIKADPTLIDSEIRIVSHEGEPTRVSPRTVVEVTTVASGGAPAVAAPAVAEAAVHPLDRRGTRRAPRIRMGGAVGVLVDGNAATLIDLSTIGAQVVSSSVLKPNQRVRMALSDDHGTVRFNAAIAWASFEIPAKSGPRYRAGIEFVDADGVLVEGFCHRHKA